ncbi:MAG: DUF1559 domain-containing protein [Gemmataceae bacterium]|nr:DUF1559 domain-containing protein [Gemmataceae bacterium]
MTLIEICISSACLALLMGLLVPAVFRVRLSADYARSRGNIGQILIATNSLASEQGGCLRKENDNRSLFSLLLKHIDSGAIQYKTETSKSGTTYRSITGVGLYLCPGDSSLFYPFGDSSDLGNCSYAYNSHVLPDRTSVTGTNSSSVTIRVEGRAANLTSMIPDGLSNTILIGQHYARCRSSTPKRGDFTDFDFSLAGSSGGGKRRASLGDIHYGDFAATFSGIENAGKAFQITPQVLDCDHRQLQATFPSGLLVGMADGSVRALSGNIPPRTIWALLTPAGGETIGE